MTATLRPVGHREFLLGTNWKMTKTLGEAVAYVDELVEIGVPSPVRAFLLPAHTALATVRDRLVSRTDILFGAQDAHWAAEGPHSGEVSMRMVRDAGATVVMTGHAERRRAGETDADVSLKTAAALEHGLIPLVCVGEPLEVRDRGHAADFVSTQVWSALSRIDPSADHTVWVAYEPLWAIGERGAKAEPAVVSQMVSVVREVLDRLGMSSRRTPVLYGGSVDASQVAGLAVVPGLGGLFVGRAAWRASDFAVLSVEAARALGRADQPVQPDPRHQPCPA